MPKFKAPPPAAEPAAGVPLAALCWGAIFLALALIPDQKLLRLKLLASECGVVLLAAGWLARHARLRGPALAWTSTPLDAPVAVYAVSAVLFFCLSPEPRNSEPELARMLLAALTFFCASQSSAACPPRWILRCWALGAGLAALYALLQRAGGLGFLTQVERPASTFGNPIFLSCFLAASLPAAAVLLADSEGPEAIAACASVLLQGAALWLTQSRAGFAGLIAAAALWSLRRLPAPKRARLLAGLALFGFGLWLHFRGRAWTHGMIWRDTLALWRAHPWLGCGLGRFHLEFPAYASLALRAVWPQESVIVNYAHNEYLQVLAETGVAGLAAFASVPVALLYQLLRRAQAPTLAEAPALAAAALFACAFFSPDLRFGVSAFLAFACLGLWAGREAGRPRAFEGRGKAALLAAGAALAACFGRLAAAPALAALRLRQEPSFHAAPTPEGQRALEQAEARLAREPRNAGLAEEIAFLYAKERAWPQAAARFKQASALDPRRPGPYNNLGNIAYVSGDAEGAIAYWEKSLEVKPDQLDAHLNLAKLLYERGRLKPAAHHCQEALRLDPSNPKARAILKRMVE